MPLALVGVAKNISAVVYLPLNFSAIYSPGIYSSGIKSNNHDIIILGLSSLRTTDFGAL